MGLYEQLLSGADAGVIDAHMREQAGFDKADSVHFDALLHGCIREAADLDAVLGRHADRKTRELSPVEHGVLRIGAYEFKHCIDVPCRVAINEASSWPSPSAAPTATSTSTACYKAAAELRPVEVQAARAARRPRRSENRDEAGRAVELIEPFYVMECAKAASRSRAARSATRPRAGAPMIFLNIGEPDFTAPPLVQRSRARVPCERAHPVHRRHRPARAARGHLALVWRALRPRRAGAAHRRHRRRVGRAAAGQAGAVRPGRRGADARPELSLQPALRRGRRRAGGAARSDAPRRFQLDADSVRAAWNEHTRGVLLASPSNPTGTSIEAARDAPHRRSGARARRRGPRRRDLPGPELRRVVRPQRARSAATT